MIGYCGLDCDQCGAFIATRNNDNALRIRVAEEWSRLFNASIKPEHINCTGCKSAGVKTYHCDQLCEVRKCAVRKSISTCAECSECPCALLKPIFEVAPQAKRTLEALRNR
jgi:hypothetical protein